MYVRRDMEYSPAGCVFQDYMPRWVFNTAKTPAATAHALAELRLIDQDAYVVMTPGFDKCDAGHYRAAGRGAHPQARCRTRATPTASPSATATTPA